MRIGTWGAATAGNPILRRPAAAWAVCTGTGAISAAEVPAIGAACSWAGAGVVFAVGTCTAGGWVGPVSTAGVVLGAGVNFKTGGATEWHGKQR